MARVGKQKGSAHPNVEAAVRGWQTHEYANAGVTLPIAAFPFGSDKAMIAQTVEALGPSASERV